MLDEVRLLALVGQRDLKGNLIQGNDYTKNTNDSNELFTFHNRTHC